MPDLFSPETRAAHKALQDEAWAVHQRGGDYAFALAGAVDRLVQTDPQTALRARGYASYLRALGQKGNAPYAVWVTATDWSHPNPNKAKRLGTVRLRQVLTEDVRAALVVNQGAAAYIRVMSKNGVPVVSIRARYGADLKVVARALANLMKAQGIALNVLSATAPARKVIEEGI